MRARLRSFLADAPLKLVAVVLFAILVPSVLVTSLGLVAVFQADAFVRERFRGGLEAKLTDLKGRLETQWGERLALYAEYLRDADRRLAYLGGLRREDPCVRDVLVTRALTTGDGELDLVRDPPPRDLSLAGRAGLGRLDELEVRKRDDDGALAEALRLLGESVDEGVLVEARLAAARIMGRMGRPGAALRYLREALEASGDTVDATGVVRAVPILWRILMMHLEESAPAPAREAARELGEALGRFEPWLPADVLAHYRTKLAALFPDLPPGGTPPAAERLFGPGDLAALEPRLHPPGVSYAPDPVPSRPVSYPVVHAGREHDVVSVPTDGGEAVVHLFLDRAALRAEAARAASDVGFREEGLAFAGAGEPAVAETLRTALPPPLAHLELRYVPADGEVSPGFLAFGLEVIPLATFTWAVVVLVLTIVVGAFFTLRSVLREMRTARLKTDFVSFISHELKTPLTAIRLCSEMLLSGRAGSEEEQKTCLRMLDGESERLARLIDQILQYAQIEQRQKQFHFAACNMREVVEEAVRLFAEHTKDDPREVEINAVQSISKIRMDRAAMIELLLNLLTNAAKYSSSGSRIVINVRESIEDISVDVVDQGIGIRKRDQKRIFEKFYRADDYLTREVEGTGLGLAFARYIARVHNGEIKVSSQVRGGSVFTVYLRKTEVLAE